MLWMWLLAISVLVQVVAEITCKEYSLSGSWNMATITLTLNIVSSIFWMAYMRTNSLLAIGSSIWGIAISLSAVVIGVAMYQETLTGTQCVGVVLGIVSLVLLF